jgi:hypothetical protein
VFVKLEAQHEARRLRAVEGLSIKAIAARLDVAVSSVSRWTRDVELSPEQLARLHGSARHARQAGNRRRSANARAARELAQEHGREFAAQGNLLHVQGCMLYWAEGSKDRNNVRFTNADADMVALFLRFLRECYEVPNDRVALSVAVHLGNGLTMAEVARWWLDHLALPRTCLRSGRAIPAESSPAPRRRMLTHGTARLAVSSTFIVQSIYGAIQAYAQTVQPDWLG